MLIRFWFWDYASLGLFKRSAFFEIYDRFMISSLDSREDEIIYNTFVFPNIISEWVYLQCLLKYELEQRFYDVEQLHVSLVSALGGETPYYPLRFNKKALCYEVFNYSQLCLGEPFRCCEVFKI
jgi:hypothetical protein